MYKQAHIGKQDCTLRTLYYAICRSFVFRTLLVLKLLVCTVQNPYNFWNL